MRKEKKFKTRWIYKALTWRIISILLGGAMVHWLTGQFSLAWRYMLYYTPISIVLYLLHEVGWQWWKNRQRKKYGIIVVEVSNHIETNDKM